MIKSKTIHPNVIVNTFKREFSNKTYICKQCNIEFLHMENYKLHYDIHHKAKQTSIFNCCVIID